MQTQNKKIILFLKSGFLRRIFGVKGQRSKVKGPRTRGFTLVETLVAVAILMLTIVGPISMIGDSVHRAYFTKDQLIAVNLAQEGIEAARWMRDTNRLNGLLFNTGIANGNYVLDIGRIPANPFIVGIADPIIYFDIASGLHRQGTVFTATQFSRTINISGSGDEIKVASTVTWRTGGETGTVSASESLFKTF